ncbi:MAG: TatD family hydrolase [Candidatus Marsarchaeota archaeon]|nr:TatD family hydrolase [Candidatus Marsarchaeota archaeon]
MPEKLAVKEMQKMELQSQKLEMADSHCHLDMLDTASIMDSISYGVLTMITNGINYYTNKKALEISDHKHVFPAIGIDPDTAIQISDEDLDDEINRNIELIKANSSRIVSIGEIGLDFKKASTFELVAKQRTVFERFVDVAIELGLPVSVHSRDAMDTVLEILKEKKTELVHLHFFEGNVQQAKEAERLGYMISIPPLESSKRMHVMKDVAIDHLLVESDAPAAGKTPKDVEKSIRMIAAAKRMGIDKVAETITQNTKSFFKIHGRGLMRS